VDSPRLDRRRFLIAVAASVVLVLSAPFLGEIRRQLQRTFPASFVWIVGGAMAALLAAALAAAAVRIRTHRALRTGAILAALAVAALYAFVNARESRDSNVVELVHFLQYGVVTLLFYRACRAAGDASMLIVPLLAGLVVGTAEEALQWFLPARVGELRDLYLNLTAISCGLVFSIAVDPPTVLDRRLRQGSARFIGRVAAIAVVALALFVDVVHLGQRIRDDEIGTFDSRYSPEELTALQVERAEQWRVEPPLRPPPRVSREDQYMTEGLQHVQERNRAWTRGSALAAWSENRILEKYFAAVLDTPSYVSPTGHRWSDAQQSDAAARASIEREGNPAILYVSAAYPYPLFTWPRPLFWVAVSVIVAAILLVSAIAERRSRMSHADAARLDVRP
jgi:VanZ family protein